VITHTCPDCIFISEWRWNFPSRWQEEREQMKDLRKFAMDAIEGWIAKNKRNYVNSLYVRRRERCQAGRWLAAQHKSVLRETRIPSPSVESAKRPWLPLVRVLCLMVAADVTARVKLRLSNATLHPCRCFPTLNNCRQSNIKEAAGSSRTWD
jgi:hypothetical protein